MSNERCIAALVAASGYSTRTVRKWWNREHVRERTAKDLQTHAKKLKLRRPRRDD